MAQASLAQICAVANSLNSDHPAFDEVRGLLAFASAICHEPETAFEEYASKLLCADKIRYLNQKIPRQNFESIAGWAAAVAEEIKSVLVAPAFELDGLDPATEALRTETIEMQLFVTTIHVRNFLDDDLDQQERLDARIARLIRELIEIKTNKEVLRRKIDK